MKVKKSGMSLERLRNSVNGGPRWRATFSDGTSFETAPDAQVGHTIENSEFRGDVVVTLERARITHIEAA